LWLQIEKNKKKKVSFPFSFVFFFFFFRSPFFFFFFFFFPFFLTAAVVNLQQSGCVDNAIAIQPSCKGRKRNIHTCRRAKRTTELRCDDDDATEKKKKKKKKNSNLCQFDSNLISICPVRLPLAVAVNAASRTSIELISSAFSRQNGKK
jgi:hypothetical protein